MTQDQDVLPFSVKYDAAHSQAYLEKHRTGIRRLTSNFLEQRMARKALRIAGNASSVLDLPCGTGRFWELLFSRGIIELLAADYSRDMLDVARRTRPSIQLAKTKLLQTSAFAIDLPDRSVDLVFCMRLMHHIGEAEDRRKILREFARVTRGYTLVSLWIDGNYQASRRRRLERTRDRTRFQNRYVTQPGQFEADAVSAGHEVIGHVDLLPGISMWRTYVLKCS